MHPTRKYHLATALIALLLTGLLLAGRPWEHNPLSPEPDSSNTPSTAAFTTDATVRDSLTATGIAATTPGGLDINGPAIIALINTLNITGHSPTGYHRDAFGPAWADIDRNGCDTRNDILARDMTTLAYHEDGHTCIIASGTLHDPYTGTTIKFTRGQTTSSTVQIDHIIPLAAAWTGGANTWTDAQRQHFANDPLNLQATNGPANAAKSDKGPGEWLPENQAYQCEYIARYTTLAHTYNIAITHADKSAITATAAGC